MLDLAPILTSLIPLVDNASHAPATVLAASAQATASSATLAMKCQLAAALPQLPAPATNISTTASAFHPAPLEPTPLVLDVSDPAQAKTTT